MTINSVQKLLPQIYELLKQGEIEQAGIELNMLFQKDLENADILYALTGVNFWKDKLKKALEATTTFERGEFIVSQWKPFIGYMQKQGSINETTLYALKNCAFLHALNYYQSLYNENGATQDPELYRKIGLCYKALGNYEQSLHLLELAKEGANDSPPILAELADCYMLCGETRLGKVLFREAFFLGASAIDLQFLESEIIQRLASQVQSLGYTDSQITEWIPIYGVLYGVFNIKRELRALEFGKLKQAIYALENEINDVGPELQAMLVPRLINHYFWLIDHYVNVNDDKAKVDEVLLKIKLLDTGVYKKYTM